MPKETRTTAEERANWRQMAPPDSFIQRLLDDHDTAIDFGQQAADMRARTYSAGRTAADDAGDLAAMLTVDHVYHRIRLQFAKPTPWVSMTEENAATMIRLLQQKLDQLRRGK